MDKQLTIINSKGQRISVEKYDSVDFEGFVNGYAIVWLNNKAGFINEKGEEICPIKYDMLLPFRKIGYPTILIEVNLKDETVWLNLEQMEVSL